MSAVRSSSPPRLKVMDLRMGRSLTIPPSFFRSLRLLISTSPRKGGSAGICTARKQPQTAAVNRCSPLASGRSQHRIARDLNPDSRGDRGVQAEVERIAVHEAIELQPGAAGRQGERALAVRVLSAGRIGADAVREADNPTGRKAGGLHLQQALVGRILRVKV